MNRHRWTQTLIVALSLISMAWAGQPGPTPANWGQAHMEDWVCPGTYAPATGTVPLPTVITDMPLPVALSTTGGPVLISFTMNTDQNHGGGTYLTTQTLLVNQAAIGVEVSWLPNQHDARTFTHIMALPAGGHSFGVAIACHNSNPITWAADYYLTVTQAWLSVYELPSVPK
jgi:hypothetical protein